MAGLTANGFEIKRLADIKSELETAFKGSFPNITVEADSVFGQIIGIMSEREALIWEILQLVYLSQYPTSAEGFSLDGICQYIGVTRAAATYTEAPVLLIGDDGTVVPEGTLFSVSATGKIFEQIADVTISESNLLRAKVEITESHDSKDYGITINTVDWEITSGIGWTTAQIATALMNAINVGQDEVDASIDPENSSVIILIAEDQETAWTGEIDSITWPYNEFIEISSLAQTEAQDAGDVLAVAGSLDTIETPVSGLDEVINIVDGVIGRNLETDRELRIRREQSLRLGGSGTVEAIRSRILEDIESVTACSVFENMTDVTDGDGRPPHSFEAVVQGGADQDIGELIWEVKPAGIQTFGDVDVDVVDSQGDTQVMYFSRPTEKYAHVRVVVTESTEETFPDGGLTTIKNSILDFGETFLLGEDMIYQEFFKYIYCVAGIASVTLEIAVTNDPLDPPSWVTTNISIAAKEIAIFDIDRIDVSFAP